MRVLIVGCGYVGLPLGAELARRGHEVFGLRRSASTEGELTAAGIKPLYADISDVDQLSKLPCGYDWVINCAAAGGGTLEDYRRTYLNGTQNLLAWLSTSPPQKYIYTSSTGVYGHDDGSWVAEADATDPASDSGKVLVETERLLLKAAKGKKFPAIILRLAGIYGPGRGYWLRQFLRGEVQLEGSGERFLNMVHRDDVIGAIMAALEKAEPGSIFNVVDDEPAAQVEVFKWLAQRLGKPLPPVAAEAGSAARRRSATNKRVSNFKLRKELGYRLIFPTFREGYEAELTGRIGG